MQALTSKSRLRSDTSASGAGAGRERISKVWRMCAGNRPAGERYLPGTCTGKRQGNSSRLRYVETTGPKGFGEQLAERGVTGFQDSSRPDVEYAEIYGDGSPDHHNGSTSSGNS